MSGRGGERSTEICREFSKSVKKSILFVYVYVCFKVGYGELCIQYVAKENKLNPTSQRN